MKNTLVETVGFSFTAPIITQLSSLVDETEPGVEKALHKSVPLVLNGLAGWVGQGLTPDGLLGLVREAEQAHVLRQLADLSTSTTSGHERGSNLLLDLLGDGYRGTVNRIAVEAGIRPTASGTLLQVAATAVVGVLGQIAAEYDLPAADFVYWLRAQKADIATAMLPIAGTSVTGNPEYHLVRQGAAATQLAPVPTTATWADQDAEPAAPTGPGAWRWQWGALLLLAVCLGYFFGHNQFGPAPVPTEPYPLAETRSEASPAPLTPDAGLPPELLALEPPPALAAPARPLPRATPALPPLAAYRQRRAQPAPSPDAGGRYDQDRDTYIYDTGRPIVLTLADGTTQKVGANSTENRLYTFLASPAIQVDSVNRTKGWINFDRINFETGKALLTPESALQLGNIASILATFPRAVIKIGGYTDSTGDALANFQLSEDRARAAMRTLAGMGVSPNRLQAKGYGPKYFVKPNNSPTGRALNRRISIRVVSK